MDKLFLLEQLALVRDRAEEAHLEIVIQTQTITELESDGRDTDGARIQLNHLKMAEQKLIMQMTWILDQLDAFWPDVDRND